MVIRIVDECTYENVKWLVNFNLILNLMLRKCELATQQ